jgi:hypothetical protein
MASKLDAIRNKVKELGLDTMNTFPKGSGNFPTDNTIYRFWDAKPGSDSIVRFLPDKDLDNPFFFVERAMIELPFEGIVGSPEASTVTVRVPCMDMYKEEDPIIAETRAWWNDPELEPLARTYWKKRSYLYQGFVTEDGVREQSVPENPIRRFIIGPQLHKIIKTADNNPDFDKNVTDYYEGTDFRIVKTSKGQHADYTTSQWSRRTRPLSDKEMEAIDKYGLFDLKSFLPKKPNDAEKKAIIEMFQASVNGEPYDPARWGQYYKPFEAGNDTATATDTTNTAATPSVTTVSSNIADEDVPEFPSPSAVATETSTAASPQAADILKMIRNRGNA